MKIAVIGAGHAGVEAAAAARAGGANEVTLFTAEPCLPYFRPRLIAVAFGQAEPGAIAMHDAAWYESRGITLRPATVQRIDPAACLVDGEPFDGIIIANGANPMRIPLAGATDDMPLLSLWNIGDAQKLRARATPGHRLLIIGGGLLGVEAALRAQAAGLRVALVERLPRLMANQLGETAAKKLRDQLAAHGIDVHCGACVQSVSRDNDALNFTLDTGDTLIADILLFSMGARPDLTLAKDSGLTTNRGIIANTALQAAPKIFVAGDVAEVDGMVRGSARDASAQGKLAAANLVATLNGLPPTDFPSTPPSTFLNAAGVSVYAVGRAATDTSTETRLDDGSDPAILRVVIKEGDTIIGVQQLGTRQGLDELAAKIR